MKAKLNRVPIYVSNLAFSRQAIITIERTDKAIQQIKPTEAFFKLNKGETLDSKAKLLAQHIAGNKYKSHKLIIS